MNDDELPPKVGLLFRLSDKEFKAFLRHLRHPRKPNKKLSQLMHRKPPWQHDEPNSETIAALEAAERKEGDLFDGPTSDITDKILERKDDEH